MTSDAGSFKSRSHHAYDLLRTDIVRGTLAPGEKLRIGDLQARYDIGAIPLREALNRLSAEMLVEKLEQRGFRVPPLNIEASLQIVNARLVIEIAALRQSLAARDSAWEDRVVLAHHHLTKVAMQAEAEGDKSSFLLTDAWAETHKSFHFELISACENAWLLKFSQLLYEQSARYRARRRQISSLREPVRRNLIAEHTEILNAALAGDEELTATLLANHYRRSLEIVMDQPTRMAEGALRVEIAAPAPGRRSAERPGEKGGDDDGAQRG